MRSESQERHCSAACSAGSMSTARVGCWLTDAGTADVVVVGAVGVGLTGAESVVVAVVAPGLVVVVVLVIEPVVVDFALPATRCYFELGSFVMVDVLAAVAVIVPKTYLLGLPAAVASASASVVVAVAVANAFASVVAVVAAVAASDGCE